ncbi:B-cell linker protein [Aplochiton taeniatus]
MDTLNKLVAPASEKLRQIQKMVRDIKANDGHLINRLRRFTNTAAPNEDYISPKSDTDDDYVEPTEDTPARLYEVPSLEADILRKPWYARTRDRKEAENALIRSNKDGSFLVRQSSGQDVKQPYTLVVFYHSRVYNIPVRHIPTSQQYALGSEKKGEERFRSVSHIIEHHRRNSLVLIDSQSNTKDATRLCYPVQP